MSAFWLIVVTFSSAFSGVFLGQVLNYAVGLHLRRKEAEVQRVQAKASIANELRKILSTVENYLGSEALVGELTIPILFTNAKDAAVGSGSFGLIEPDLQERINTSYAFILQGNDQVRRMRDFVASAGLFVDLPYESKEEGLAMLQDQLGVILKELPGQLSLLVDCLQE